MRRKIYTWENERRRRFLLGVGLAAVALFLVVRYLNFYGDPVPWQPQITGWFTVLSFLNTTKYPDSQLFLLMTLGQLLIFLAAVDSLNGKGIVSNILLHSDEYRCSILFCRCLLRIWPV